MYLTTAQAAQELGVSQRQVRRFAAAGKIDATQYGRSYLLSAKQVLSLQRTKQRGRKWSEVTVQSALELLSAGDTELMNGSEKSRLRTRLRTMSVEALADQLLRGRVIFRRSLNDAHRDEYTIEIASELGLISRGGLGVLVGENVAAQSRRLRLVEDFEGNVATVEGSTNYRALFEALVLYTYGSARECEASSVWLQHTKLAV